jgi:hypothetical protein
MHDKNLLASAGTYFKYAQSVVHSLYLHHVFNLFKLIGVLNMETPSLGKYILKGVEYQWLAFSTKSYKSLNTLYESWYINGVKLSQVI